MPWMLQMRMFIVIKQRLDQVLLNLLSNAIKFTPAGEPFPVRLKAVSGAKRAVGCTRSG